ncbi:hypothetical protein ABEV00_06535 [Paenibacillus thiaminolyticus]|uniref:hypothetical protein n=1 Tax=Paenibacillus TaxID=44249 RepID=UPI00105A7466|nr:hypothetical protein [Paenibacillus dendritiformis]TDL54260.1 hypothetical protein E2R60_14705 [Paenibacillus dendritiformis]
MKKKTLSFIVVFTMLVSIFPTTIFAQNNENSQVVKEETAVTDDGYTIKVVETTSYVNTEVFDPVGNFVDATKLDLKSGEVTYTKKDGTVTLSHFDDYVDKVTIDVPEEKLSSFIAGNPFVQGQVSLNEDSSPQFTVQALIDEPVTDDGLQDSVYGDGYKFLGSSGVWYFDDYGYLFRKIDSMTKHEAHQFTFSEGTAVSTILSIVVGAFTGGAWSTIVITSLLITASGVLVDYFRGTFDYRTYNYLYKVRVYTQPWFETYRNISYWVSYNDATETLKFKQKSFNHGFSPANFEMVKAGIDKYMEANPKK